MSNQILPDFPKVSTCEETKADGDLMLIFGSNSIEGVKLDVIETPVVISDGRGFLE